jgi:hypothetical protein
MRRRAGVSTRTLFISLRYNRKNKVTPVIMEGTTTIISSREIITFTPTPTPIMKVTQHNNTSTQATTDLLII